MIDEIPAIDNQFKYSFWGTLKSIIKDKVKSTLENCDTDTKLRIIKAYPKAIKYIKNEDKDFRLKATRMLKDKIIEYIPKEGEKIGDEKIEDIIRTSLVSELPFLIEQYKGENTDVLFAAAKQNRTIMKNFVENKNGNWKSLHIGYNKLKQDEKKEKWFELFEYHREIYGKNKICDGFERIINNGFPELYKQLGENESWTDLIEYYGKKEIWNGIYRITDNEKICGDITEIMKKYNGENEKIREILIEYHYDHKKDDETKKLVNQYRKRAENILEKYKSQENKIKTTLKNYEEMVRRYNSFFDSKFSDTEKRAYQNQYRKHVLKLSEVPPTEQR